MTIEFADPGYNWAFVWWPLGVLVLAIVAAVILVRLDFEQIAGTILGLSISAMIIVPSLLGVSGYASNVSNLKAKALAELDFSNVDMSDDRFTAATEDGQYFEGVLVDLRPDEGYAYEVLELNRTGD